MADPTALRVLDEDLAEHAETFDACYGSGAEPRLFFSPGRVNLFGGHLDYNGGPVMPTAIDRGTFVAARLRSDRTIRFASTTDPRGLELDLDAMPTRRQERWVDYPLGVLLDVVVRARGRGQEDRFGGLDLMFGGNLPIGAGLSSSASMCVGTAFALDKMWDLGLGAEERVRSALRAERGFVGVQCGIMDPFAVGFARPGHLLWLDCKDESFEHLPLDPRQVAILVADTGVKRELAASEFNRRVDQCSAAFQALRPHVAEAEVLRDIPLDVLETFGGQLDPVLLRRAGHVVHEVVRTFLAREALLAGDLDVLGAQMFATHDSLRDLYEVSCPELDTLVDAAREADGALGSRLTGAGFGGCTVSLVRREAADEVSRHLSARFEREFGTAPRIEVFGGDEGPRECHLDD